MIYFTMRQWFFFRKDSTKHTSESVIAEIESFKVFMNKFGRDLNSSLANNTINKILYNPWIYFQGYNANQQPLIEQFLHTMVGRVPTYILSEYRTLKKTVTDRIKDALSMTQQPFIQQSSDKIFIGLIGFVNDPDDKQIVADAAFWAAQFKFRGFCTSDNEHIMKHKPSLEITICKHYGRNCLIFTHLKNA